MTVHRKLYVNSTTRTHMRAQWLDSNASSKVNQPLQSPGKPKKIQKINVQGYRFDFVYFLGFLRVRKSGKKMVNTVFGARMV